LLLSSVKLAGLCPTIKGSQSLETLLTIFFCKIFEQCLFCCVWVVCGYFGVLVAASSLKMVPVPCAVAIKDDEEKDEDDVAQVEKL
jgi:hypothetical protein